MLIDPLQIPVLKEHSLLERDLRQLSQGKTNQILGVAISQAPSIETK